MGQTNTKPQRKQQRPTTTTTTEHRRSLRQDKPELTIQPQATFDSHFTLISPMSELSNPSMFLPKRHEQNIAANIPPGSNQHTTSNNIVFENVPPLPEELQQKFNLEKKRAAKQQVEADKQVLLKKKRGRRKSKSKQKAQRIKEAFAGCVIVSAEHADKMRAATTKTVAACAKKTGECAKKTGQMIENSGVVERSGVAALNCAKATKEVAAAGAKELAQAVKKGCVQSHISDKDERKHDRMSEAARNSLDVVNQSDHAILVPIGELPPSQFQPDWRANIPQGSNLYEVTTPLAQLDRVFATAAGLHREDAYFDRLSAGSVAPSPFVDGLPDISAVPPITLSKGSPVNVSLFSETTLTRIGTSDLNFAREVRQPVTIRISDFDAKQEDESVSSGVLQHLKKRRNTSTLDEGRRSSIDINKQKVKSKAGPKNTKASNSSRSIFRQMESRKSHAGIKEQNSFGSLRVTESAPSVLETKDYRNIALSTSEGGVSAASAPVCPQYYTLCSPSALSTTSTGEHSRGPLLTTQTLSNAAFLFSPSYAGGDQQLLQREQTTRDPAFSISTFASRARLSSFSSRLQPAITIPVSKSWEANSAAITKGREYDFSGSHARVDKSHSNRHVRFSDANQYRESQIAKPSMVSVQRKKPQQKIETRQIETKMSDLTEASMLYGRTSFEGVSPASTASSISNRSGHCAAFPQVSARGLPHTSSGMSPSNSEHDVQSATSSKKQGSINWTSREENGQVTTTPKFGKKRTSSRALPTTSPMNRFRSAQHKFANPAEKVVPVRRTPPKKFLNRTPKKTLVSGRITVLNDRLKSTKQPVVKNPRRDTSGHRVLAPHKASLVNPIFRNTTPAASNTTKGQRKIRTNPTEESPFDETEANVSPIAASHTSSAVSGDMFAKLILGSSGTANNEASFSIAETDVSEDPFADIITSNYEAEPETFGASKQQRGTSLDRNSMLSFASHSSSTKRYSVGSTVVTDKENSVLLTNLHKTSGKGQVNPADVYHRQDNTVHLCLSPRQRTPMQARKWRTLAAAAQEKESSKKSIIKRAYRKGLSEKSVNVE